MIRAIVCIDKKWGIGKDNHLLFDLPEDMEFFKKATTGSVVCMGYNTFLSLPNQRPLQNRTNIVICQKDVEIPGATVCHDLLSLSQEIQKYYHHTDVYIIGGAMLYKTMLPYCEEVYVTKVLSEEEADAFFEDLNANTNFVLFSNSGIKRSVSGKMFCFTAYKNLHIKRIKDLGNDDV